MRTCSQGSKCVHMCRILPSTLLHPLVLSLYHALLILLFSLPLILSLSHCLTLYISFPLPLPYYFACSRLLSLTTLSRSRVYLFITLSPLKVQVCSYNSVVTKAIDHSVTEWFLLVAATTQPRPSGGFLSCPPLPPGRLGPPSHPTATNSVFFTHTPIAHCKNFHTIQTEINTPKAFCAPLVVQFTTTKRRVERAIPTLYAP